MNATVVVLEHVCVAALAAFTTWLLLLAGAP